MRSFFAWLDCGDWDVMGSACWQDGCQCIDHGLCLKRLLGRQVAQRRRSVFVGDGTSQIRRRGCVQGEARFAKSCGQVQQTGIHAHHGLCLIDQCGQGIQVKSGQNQHIVGMSGNVFGPQALFVIAPGQDKVTTCLCQSPCKAYPVICGPELVRALVPCKPKTLLAGNLMSTAGNRFVNPCSP